jgi:hypothetical protein
MEHFISERHLASVLSLSSRCRFLSRGAPQACARLRHGAMAARPIHESSRDTVRRRASALCQAASGRDKSPACCAIAGTFQGRPRAGEDWSGAELATAVRQRQRRRRACLEKWVHISCWLSTPCASRKGYDGGGDEVAKC